MNAEEFVNKIRIIVRDQAIRDMIEILSNPPGRKPNNELLTASNWFNQLDLESRQKIEWIIGDSIDAAIFGILCMLDGVRSFDDNNSKLVLQCFTANETVTINDERSSLFLHELYKS